MSFWLLSGLPPEDATNEEIRSFYRDESSRQVLLVGLYLVPFAGMAFVWFVVALRMWIEASRASRRSLLQSNLQLVSGIIYIATLFAGGAAYAVIGASVEWGGSDVDPAAAREFPVYGQLLFVFALRIGAMFVITTCRSAAAHGSSRAGLPSRATRSACSCWSAPRSSAGWCSCSRSGSSLSA